MKGTGQESTVECSDKNRKNMWQLLRIDRHTVKTSVNKTLLKIFNVFLLTETSKYEMHLVKKKTLREGRY